MIYRIKLSSQNSYMNPQANHPMFDGSLATPGHTKLLLPNLKSCNIRVETRTRVLMRASAVKSAMKFRAQAMKHQTS